MLKLNISCHICIFKIKYSLTLNVTDMIFKTIPSLISTTAYCQWTVQPEKKETPCIFKVIGQVGDSLILLMCYPFSSDLSKYDHKYSFWIGYWVHK